jgi:hypothetical protein
MKTLDSTVVCKVESWAFFAKDPGIMTLVSRVRAFRIRVAADCGLGSTSVLQVL